MCQIYQLMAKIGLWAAVISSTYCRIRVRNACHNITSFKKLVYSLINFFLVFHILKLHLCFCPSYKRYWPRPDDIWWAALARNWRMFLLCPLQTFSAGPSLPAKAGADFLLPVLQRWAGRQKSDYNWIYRLRHIWALFFTYQQFHNHIKLFYFNQSGPRWVWLLRLGLPKRPFPRIPPQHQDWEERA